MCLYVLRPLSQVIILRFLVLNLQSNKVVRCALENSFACYHEGLLLLSSFVCYCTTTFYSWEANQLANLFNFSEVEVMDGEFCIKTTLHIILMKRLVFFFKKKKKRHHITYYDAGSLIMLSYIGCFCTCVNGALKLYFCTKSVIFHLSI